MFSVLAYQSFSTVMEVWIYVTHYTDSEKKSMWVLLVLFCTHVAFCRLLSLLFHLTFQSDKTLDKHTERQRQKGRERPRHGDRDMRQRNRERQGDIKRHQKEVKSHINIRTSFIIRIYSDSTRFYLVWHI